MKKIKITRGRLELLTVLILIICGLSVFTLSVKSKTTLTFEGQGVFTSHSGWIYKGGFKNGQPDGEGTLTAQNGKVYTGTFKQGIFQK